jgi:hypothetical protein
MKKFAIGASIATIALFGFFFIGLNHVQADQVIPLTIQEGLSSTDAASLKQGLDVLKKTLDLIQAKIDTTPAPIPNAIAINFSLSELKTSLRRIDSTLAALSRSNNLATNQNSVGETGVETQSSLLSLNQLTANNQLASVESVYDLKKLIWPATAVLAVIVAALIMIVLRRKMVKSKIGKVQRNIQEMKEKVAVKPVAPQQSQLAQKSQPEQQNVGL